MNVTEMFFMVQLPEKGHPAFLSAAPVFVQFPQDVDTLEKDQKKIWEMLM